MIKFPQGVASLFFIQLFSSLSYFCISATLILYTTNWLRLSDTLATTITAAFLAINFAVHLLGGIAGGRLLSFRSLFAIGMLCQIVGCVLIATPTTSFLYWGLATFLTGSGLNVVCINCMLTQRFKADDKQREMAFMFNYSSMNFGAFIGYFMGGYFHLFNAYRALFLLSAVGNLLALIFAAIQWPYLRDVNTPISQLTALRKLTYNLFGLSLIIASIFCLRWLFDHAAITNQFIIISGFGMFTLIGWLATRQPTAMRKKMLTYLVLSFAGLVFWMLYQLAPMGLTLFIERNIDRHLMGFLIPPPWVQNLNPMIIMVGGPLLGLLFSELRKHGYPITIPFQFACALTLIGIGYGLLPIGIHYADSLGYSTIEWVIACLVFQSLGELFLSPIGYAMIGQYAPSHLQGLMMGTWMLVSGMAATLSAHFSRLALGNTASTDPLLTNISFSHTFSMMSAFAIAAGLTLFLLVPRLVSMTHEKNE